MLLTVSGAQAQTEGRTPAFPGAEGYGKYTSGGRGGEVYYVTSLDDCSDRDLVPGTLRWALCHDNGGKPRTILFAVAGTINLTSRLKVQYPNVSILGQSAPGGGICLSGFNLSINQRNVIVRHIRMRVGDLMGRSVTGLDIENARDVIIDHCSMTWSMEECVTAYDTNNTTIQWCILGEGLYNSFNGKGARAYAAQWGGHHSTMHHSLITNSHSRSPRFNGVRRGGKPGHDWQVDSEFANNVIYNWSSNHAIYGGENLSPMQGAYNRVFMISNYYRPGPSTQKGTQEARYWVAASSGENSIGRGSVNTVGQWYVSGNKFELSSKWAPATKIWSNKELKKVNKDNLYGYDNDDPSRAMGYWALPVNAELKAKSIMQTLPYPLSGMKYDDADTAFKLVTSQAGASLPRYDEVDKRILDEAAGRIDPQFVGNTLREKGEYGIIDTPSDIKLKEHDTFMAFGKEVTCYPFLGMREGDKYVVDTDGDGMPDSYETSAGLNPNDSADGARITTGGYTNLEIYLNGIADGKIDKKVYETSDKFIKK